MTYPQYTQQALSRYTLPRLKRTAAELGVTPTGNKTQRQTWVNAILTHQSTQLQKVTGEQAVAPELLRTEKITFYDYEIYAGDKLIAAITHDDNLTQPWVVMVNGAEEHRADTWAKCYRYICTHYKDGTLPVQEQLSEQNDTTGNEIMAQIFNECENLGLELLNDGIYNNDEKLGEVGCTDGSWWVMRSGECQQMPCDSAMDAVWWLSMVDISTDRKSIFDEYFLEQPLEQLAGDKLQRLLEKAELVAA